MSTKPKKVTYKDQADDNTDYLVPLRSEPNTNNLNRSRPSERPVHYKSAGFYGSIYLLIILVLYTGVPISQFVIGFIYIGQCTIRQFIFIYMILSGAFGIAFVVVGFLVYFEKRKKASLSYDAPTSNPKVLKILFPLFVVLFICVFGWWIAGQVIVFQVKTQVELFDPTLPEYCHGNLYKAAYVLIFVNYILFFTLIALIALSCMPTSDEKGRKRQKRPIPHSQK